MFSKYYQDELAYLRELGREYADANPESAGWLAEPGADPDVERLLEGFAFLTARIREKLDDELPELTHALLELFWPHYLRPVPSMTVLQFGLKAKAAKKLHTVPRGAEVSSAPVDGTPCVFRVAYATEVAPAAVDALEVGPSSAPYLRLALRAAGPTGLTKLGLSSLRLHLTGPSAAARALYLTLARYTRRVRARSEKGEEVVLADARVAPVGFGPAESLLPFPSPSFEGFRLLQEYLHFPAKLMFLDVLGLGGAGGLARLGNPARVELIFDLDALPHDLPPVTADNVLLNCAPAINLLSHDADPVRLERKRVEYKLRPAGDPTHFEVYSVDEVRGLRRSEPEPRVYKPFYGFFRTDEAEPLLYKTRLARAQTARGTEGFITFLERGAPALFGDETVSIALTCSNRHLPVSLGIGDVSRPGSSVPTGVEARNVIPPTPPIPPPLDRDLMWSLLSHLSLNYLSLLRPEALRELLRLYDFRALVDRQAERTLARRLEGLLDVRRGPKTRLYRGVPVRGMGVSLELDEEKVGGEGEAYLLGAVLSEVLAQYVTLNAFSQLEVHGKKYGEVHTWPPKTGARVIL